MTLSIVSVALMSLSIQTAMSGPVQQQGAEKKGLLKESNREAFRCNPLLVGLEQRENNKPNK